jgi:hypothetical protein
MINPIALIPPTPAGKYHWTRSRVAMSLLVRFISVVAFMGWGLYVWIHVKDFGSHPQCNDQFKYVILFFTVKATERWLRGLWIAFLVLGAVGLTIVVFGANSMAVFVIKHVVDEEWGEEETNLVTPTETPGTQPHAEKETSETMALSRVHPSLLCVSNAFSLIECSCESLAQVYNIRHSHVGAYREWPYLSYPFILH